MSAIVELSVPGQEFELGRVLDTENDANIRLEMIVPLGERSIPCFRIMGEAESFEATLEDHPAVKEILIVSAHDEEVLYALDWEGSEETFFGGLLGINASILEATGTPHQWGFDLRFHTHEMFSDFQADCRQADIPITVKRIYNPIDPEAGPRYGLTAVQRETLSLAVQEDYYSLPRDCSSRDIGGHFGISDQAAIERLRRGVTNLVSNTLLVSELEDSEKPS